jgi:prevent-host-death family protein
MNAITALEFQRNLGKYTREAHRQPVEITNHGRRDLVLVSAEYFDWLNAAAQRTHKTADGNPLILEALQQSQMSPEHDHLNEEIA